MWLGGMLAALMLLIPLAVLTALASRRNTKLITTYLPTAYVACFLVSGLILGITSTRSFVLRREEIRILDLPPGLDGFRVANLGDVHFGRFIDVNELARGVAAINDEKVDMLAITGDLADDVSQFDTSNQVVAILGNHEKMGDLP